MITENQQNEILRAFAKGGTIEHIAETEEMPIEQVKQILNDNAEKVQELKTFYKTMGVS